jgi:hypothetical protein
MSDVHKRFHANAAAYLAEVLPDTEAAWMDAHTTECKACADLLARVRARLPELAHDGGHAPVSVLERWVHSPGEFTPLELELVERHFAECDVCRDDAMEMAQLAGVVRIVPRRVATQRPTRRTLTSRLVAAAALAVVVAVIRVASWRSPKAPEGLRQPPGAPPIRAGANSPQPVIVSGARQLIELREQMRGDGADSAVTAVVPLPGMGVRIRVPRLFLGERGLLAVRVLRADGVVLWADTVGARGLEREILPTTPPGGWSAASYRLEIVPDGGADTVAMRVFDFTLVRRR